MTDVFFCSAPLSDEREEMAQRTIQAWLSIPNLRVHYLTPVSLGCSLEEFQRERRIHAEQEAKGDIYVVADDDCLPLGGGDYVERAIYTMRRYPQYAILSAWPLNAKINPWEAATQPDTPDVMGHVSVGGIRFCRKGTLVGWPSQSGPGYDMQHCEAIRAIGSHVGYFHTIHMRHLGEGLSEIWMAKERQVVSSGSSTQPRSFTWQI